jgi:hypothetical protein
MTVLQNKVAATSPRNRSGVRDLALMRCAAPSPAASMNWPGLAWLRVRVRDVTEDPEGRGLIVDLRVSKVPPPAR